MPRVPGTPQYGSSPQIADQAAQGVPQRSSVTPALLSTGSAGLTQFGNDLSQAGGTMAKVAIDMQTRDNADQVFAATATARDAYQEYEQQALQRTGRNAVGVLEDTHKWWDDSTPKFMEGLTNPEARRLFEHQLQPLREASVGTLGRFEATQRRESLLKSADADMTSATNAAAAHPNDPLVQENARATIDRNIGVAAQLNGMTEAQVKDARETQLTRLHMGVIQAQVDTHPEAATAYYKEHIDEIAGTEHAKIEKMLEIGGIKVRTQDIASQAMALGKNETETLQWVSDNYSGEEEDMAKTRVSAQFAQRDQELQRQHRDASDQAYQIADKNGIDAVPASVSASMDPKAWVDMQEYYHNKAKRNEAEMVTDHAKYVETMEMAAHDTAAFIAQDPNDWRKWANTQDQQTLTALQNQAIQLKGQPPKNLRTAVDIAESLTGEAGLTGPQDKQNKLYVKNEILNALSLAQMSQPDPAKLMSDEQMVKVAHAAYVRMVDRGDLHLTHTPKAEALTEQNRIVSQRVAGITSRLNSDLKERELTDYRKEVSGVLDTILADKRRKAGGNLSAADIQKTIDFWTRKGQIDGSGYLSDARGYYFELAAQKDANGKFKYDMTKFLENPP